MFRSYENTPGPWLSLSFWCGAGGMEGLPGSSSNALPGQERQTVFSGDDCDYLARPVLRFGEATLPHTRPLLSSSQQGRGLFSQSLESDQGPTTAPRDRIWRRGAVWVSVPGTAPSTFRRPPFPASGRPAATPKGPHPETDSPAARNPGHGKRRLWKTRCHADGEGGRGGRHQWAWGRRRRPGRKSSSRVERERPPGGAPPKPDPRNSEQNAASALSHSVFRYGHALLYSKTLRPHKRLQLALLRHFLTMAWDRAPHIPEARLWLLRQ